MAELEFITDAYINDVIKASNVYDPNIPTTQGIKLRELIQLLRDQCKQELEKIIAHVGSQKGEIDCSGNPNFPPSNKGDHWIVSNVGKIGGENGIPVKANDEITCAQTNLGGNVDDVHKYFRVLIKDLNY